MKIITYSDLHLELEHGWYIPEDVDGDVLILAGDIITFRNYRPLQQLLSDWKKPVIYIAGNHEYYTQKPLNQENEAFKQWLSNKLPQVSFLVDEAISIEGTHFFGGTMWTDFNHDTMAMMHAQSSMNDFRLIYSEEGRRLTPEHTIKLHENFVTNLKNWLERKLTGKRIIISHHAPIVNPNSQYKDSPLLPAFNSLDMIDIIKKYEPDCWIYGHTHECDEQNIGKTKIISNQLGYPKRLGKYECLDFDSNGKTIKIFKDKK